MNFLNFLPQIASALPGAIQDGIPEMAGPGGFSGPMDEPDPNALAIGNMGIMPGDTPMPRQRHPSRPPGTPGKFMNALGMIGDALAMWRGGRPLYSMRLKEQQAQAKESAVDDALRNYLVDPEGAIAALMQIDPRMGIEFATKGQGEPFTLSEGQVRYDSRGRPIAGSPKLDTVEIDGVVFDKRTGQPLFESPYSKIIAGSEGSFFEQPRLGIGRGGGSRDDVPTITSQEEYDALPNGARYRDSQGNPGVKRGGPAASPPASFP